MHVPTINNAETSPHQVAMISSVYFPAMRAVSLILRVSFCPVSHPKALQPALS
jgi:hypothetical protein